MLGSLPLVAGLGVLLLLLVAAYALMPAKRKEQIATAVPMLRPEPEPLRYRSHRDLEIDEDAALIAEHYRSTAKNAYVQAALARHREQLVEEDAHQTNFRAAVAAWASDNLRPAKVKA